MKVLRVEKAGGCAGTGRLTPLQLTSAHAGQWSEPFSCGQMSLAVNILHTDKPSCKKRDGILATISAACYMAKVVRCKLNIQVRIGADTVNSLLDGESYDEGVKLQARESEAGG